jgi:tetratricopeptide (TPR) repeat protein
MKMPAAALKLLDKAEIYDSSELGIFLLRAEIFASQGHYRMAIELLKEKASTVPDPDYIDIQLMMADIYEDFEQYNEVFDCMVRCLSKAPEDEEALDRINYTVEITERFVESIELHKKLSDDFPYNELIWYNLSCAYKGAGKIEEAIEALEFVLAINENIDYAYQDLAELYLSVDNYDKALDILKDFEGFFTPDEEIYFLRGQCYEGKEDMKMARYNYKKSCHVNPSYAEAFYKLGEAYKHDDKWEQSYKAFSKAAELENLYEYRLAEAESAMVINKFEEAIDACERCVNIAINRFEAYIVLARIFMLCNDMDTVQEILNNAKDICKSTIELQYAECAWLLYSNKSKQGLQKLESLLELQPEKHLFMYYMLPELEEIDEIRYLIAAYIEK